MNDVPAGSEPTLSAEELERVDLACDLFEDVWRSGRRPALREFVKDLDSPVGRVLLLELLKVELAYRAKQGELAKAEEYQAIFPGQTKFVAALFAEAMAARNLSEVATAPPNNSAVEPGPRTLSRPMSQDSLTTTARLRDLEVLLTDPINRQVVCGRVVCPGVLIVGRRTTAHVVLPATDRQAARLHFDIDLQPAYCLLNNHSKQGTFVKGLLVQEQCDLEHGDLIRASQSVFMVQVLRGGEPAKLSRSPTVLWQPVGDSTSSAEPASPTREAAPPAPPLTPLRLPNYRLIRRLGEGGWELSG